MAVLGIRPPSSDDEGGKPDRDAMQKMLGPQAVDQMIRQAISMCWVLIPEENRSVARVEQEIRRVVDRAIANLKEDNQAFGGK